MPPAPKGAAHGKVNFKAMNMGVIKRLLRYLKAYRWQLIVVLLCILVSSITSVVGMTYLETIIDDHVKPLLLAADPDFTMCFAENMGF